MDYKIIIDAVKEAGEKVFDTGLLKEIREKGEADFVTAVDTEISSFLKEKLAAITPEIGFMSEEEDGDIKPVRWILDPIDGTTNLIYNYNLSSISLALCDNGKIVFGVVYNPFNGELFYAQRGKGAYFNGKPMPVREDSEPAESLVEFGAGSTRKQQSVMAFGIAKKVFESFLDIRRMCSSALAICYIACGRLGGYFEKVLKPWDVAAAALILEECGCKCSTWEGGEIPYDKPFSFVGGTNKCYKKLFEIIQNDEQANK